MTRRGKTRSWIAATATVLATALVAAAPAAADFPNLYGGDINCATETPLNEIRLCGGPTTTWDGQTKVDVNVILPPAPKSGADGPYPLIGNFHGWGGSKIGITAQTQSWAERGYAVFSMSDRGWGNSCGSADPDKLLSPAKCGSGYNHLMDERIEVRDAQYLISLLADEGVAQPGKIGATGYSYGGGMSMALATLRNRTMLPDGSLVPWQSPGGKPMELAAAVPQWPWTDLAYSLMPNGRTLDYVADAPYRGPDGKAPIGIEKASFVTGLYGVGLGLSNYALPGADPDADLTGWYTLINAGEPYDSNPAAVDIVDEIIAHHSSYYIDHSQPPAPLLIQSGWNDDLFPVDEAVRFYNRTRTQYPGDPISLYLMDDGHMRSQNKTADATAFQVREEAWFDHYLKGTGPAPASSAEALTTKCGGPSEGPYSAPTWKALSPGEIRLQGLAKQTISASAAEPAAGGKFDPFAGEGACATASGADIAGAATYRLAPVPEGGFTILGSPTIIADITAPADGQSGIAARLLDVTPGGTETEALIARGLLRPGVGGAGTVFQLHPQGYRVAPGHVVKLELLPADAPYSRPSNTQGPVDVQNLELRLPVIEKPGSGGGIVQEPAPVVIPPGYQPAIDYRTTAVKDGIPGASHGAIGLTRGLRATRRKLLVGVRCTAVAPCSGSLVVKVGKRRLASGAYTVPAGAKQRLRLPLTKAGRKFVAHRRQAGAKRKKFKAKLAFTDAGRPVFTLKRPVRLK